MKEKIIEFIKKKVEDAKAKGVVIGLSGGVDSTTVLFLCAKALGKNKVLGIMMPSEINEKKDTDDAINVCKKLGIKYKIIEIDSVLKTFEKSLALSDKLVKGNLMARIRMCILYYFANKEKLLVVGTGNKSEYLQGYFTLHGDGACDLMPLGDLYKTAVKKLAKELEVSKDIIEKVPSAGFWKGQSDEEELGVKYDDLDKVLSMLVDKKTTPIKVAKELNIQISLIKKNYQRLNDTQYKRQMPSICKIRKNDFYTDKLEMIDRKKTAFILVDIQEKFVPAIKDMDEVIKNSNILVKVSEILNIPLIVTEQYPKGLGHISKAINLPDKKFLIEKISFSCFGSEEFVKKIKELKVDSIILFGIEAHVCIFKTALDALKNNIEVYVVTDAISSRSIKNKSIAIEWMRESGAFIASTEIILFQLLDKAGTEEFKLISNLIK
jgi:NAD+ synthase